MKKAELQARVDKWLQYATTHYQKVPRNVKDGLTQMKIAVKFMSDEIENDTIKTMCEDLGISPTVDLNGEPGQNAQKEASVVIDLNINDMVKVFKADTKKFHDSYRRLYKLDVQLQTCRNAMEWRNFKFDLDRERDDQQLKLLREFAMMAEIPLDNETQMTRLRNKVKGDQVIFQDLERIAFGELEDEYALICASEYRRFENKTPVAQETIVENVISAMNKSNWLTALDGFKNWCHYAIIKNHLCKFDDFLGYHIYRGHGGEGKTVEVKALKNWAIKNHINFYEGSSKDVRAGFMSRAVPDSLLSAVQEETGFDDERSNEVRKALGDIGGLIPTEQKFRDAETVLSRTLCTSTTNDRRIYPQRKFLQIRFGRIPKEKVEMECLRDPQGYADRFVSDILHNIPVGVEFRPFYLQLWQLIAKLNEKTLIGDYWSNVLAFWLSKNHAKRLDSTEKPTNGAIEVQLKDGKEIPLDDSEVRIGWVALTNELLQGMVKDNDYFNKMSQCENYVAELIKLNDDVIRIECSTNNRQMVVFHPDKLYRKLKGSWDVAHNTDAKREEERLTKLIHWAYGHLRDLSNGKPCEIDADKFISFVSHEIQEL